MLSAMFFMPSRRRDHRASSRLAAVTAVDAEEIAVWVDPDLGGVRQRLADELGAGFRVQIGQVPERGVALVADPSSAVIAGLRRIHPGPGLIAVVPYRPSGGPEVAGLLDAGADDVASAGNPRELALRVRAVARRLSPSG
jgi:hypothetical protein